MTPTTPTRGLPGVLHHSTRRGGSSGVTRVRSRVFDASARQSPGGEAIRTPKGMELTDPGDWVVMVGDETWVLTDTSFHKNWVAVRTPPEGPS